MRRLFIYTLLILNTIACSNINTTDSTQPFTVSTEAELEQAIFQGENSILANDIALTKGFVVSQ